MSFKQIKSVYSQHRILLVLPLRVQTAMDSNVVVQAAAASREVTVKRAMRCSRREEIPELINLFSVN